MKIICDRAMTESTSFGVHSVECENPRYDVMLQDIIADKGIDFVLNAIKRDDIRMYLDAGDLEGENSFDDMAWTLAANRALAVVVEANLNPDKGRVFDYNEKDSGLSLTVGFKSGIHITKRFMHSQVKELNDFCVFLEGGLK